MSASKTILGAIVGAIVGVLAHVVLEAFLLKSETPWMAVVIGLLTGLGVRKFDPSVLTQVSYLRGALSGLLALAGIVVGMQVVAKVVQSQNATRPEPVAMRPAGEAPSEEAPAAEGGEATEGDSAELTERELNAPLVQTALGGVKRPTDFSPMQFAMIAIGAFLAYELARGSVKTVGASTESLPNPSLPPVD